MPVRTCTHWAWCCLKCSPASGHSGAIGKWCSRQHIEDDPPRLRQLDSRIPRDLETICLKCLEKEPGHRYTTAGELAAEFAGI